MTTLVALVLMLGSGMYLYLNSATRVKGGRLVHRPKFSMRSVRWALVVLIVASIVFAQHVQDDVLIPAWRFLYRPETLFYVLAGIAAVVLVWLLVRELRRIYDETRARR